MAAVTLGARAETTQSRSLSLEDCIQIAIQHNLDVQIVRTSPQIAQFTLSGSYGNYDPQFRLSGAHAYNLAPGGFDEQGRVFEGTESKIDSFGSGIGGLLPWGLSYDIGANMSDRYGTQAVGAPDFSNPLSIVTNQYYDLVANQSVTQLTTNYGRTSVRIPFETTSGQVGALTLRQPLLKNFWIDSTRLQIYLNKQNVKISELDVRLQIINTVSDVEQAYFDLIHAQEAVKVQQQALELAERLVSENRRRVEVGALAPLDSKQAESQAASSRADLLAAQSARGTLERVLKNLLSDNYSDWANVTVQPTDALLAIPQQFNLQESWRVGLAMRPDLLQVKLNLAKQGYVVRYQKNQLYPQLDLVGSYGFAASSAEFSGALSQINSADNPFYSVGAQLTFPLGNTGARNSYKSAKVTKEQIDLQFRQIQQATLIKIENAMAVAETSLQRVTATREARLYSESALEAEQTKLDKGKSTTFVVLQLQKDLTSARSAEIRALADYNIALARLAQNEGSTLERRLISLQVTGAANNYAPAIFPPYPPR
jgi:outer membrane protein TolC